jgi:hypothetical protein
LDSSIEALLRQAPPLSAEEENLRRAAREIPALYRPWLLPLIYLALTGFLISLCVNIASLLGRPFPSDAPFFLLHIGIFVVFLPAILAAKKMLGNTYRRDFWKVVMNNAPENLPYLFYAVFAYAWLPGLYAFSKGFRENGQPGTPSNAPPWQAFSATWMTQTDIRPLGVLLFIQYLSNRDTRRREKLCF